MIRVLKTEHGEATVADDADLSPDQLKENGGQFSRAPEPWYSKLAERWFTWPFNQTPWVNFPIVDDNLEDTIWDQYVEVVGALPQRGQFIAGGGAREDYVHASSNYYQDYKLFLGQIPAPKSIEAMLAKAQPLFREYMGSEAGCYLSRNGEFPMPTTNLYFPDAKLTPKESGRRGIFQWIYESVDQKNRFDTTQIICAWQVIVLRAGGTVPKKHPQLPADVA